MYLRGNRLPDPIPMRDQSRRSRCIYTYDRGADDDHSRGLLYIHEKTLGSTCFVSIQRFGRDSMLSVMLHMKVGKRIVRKDSVVGWHRFVYVLGFLLFCS